VPFATFVVSQDQTYGYKESEKLAVPSSKNLTFVIACPLGLVALAATETVPLVGLAKVEVIFAVGEIVFGVDPGATVSLVTKGFLRGLPARSLASVEKVKVNSSPGTKPPAGAIIISLAL
jgi:hypothetical protein